jgi:hypothetical protein
MSITTVGVSLNIAHGVGESVQIYVCTRNNIYHHDIADIMLKMVFNPITLTLYRIDTLSVHAVYNTAE